MCYSPIERKSNPAAIRQPKMIHHLPFSLVVHVAVCITTSQDFLRYSAFLIVVAKLSDVVHP